MCSDGLNHSVVHTLDVEESIKWKITTYKLSEKSKKNSPRFVQFFLLSRTKNFRALYKN